MPITYRVKIEKPVNNTNDLSMIEQIVTGKYDLKLQNALSHLAQYVTNTSELALALEVSKGLSNSAQYYHLTLIPELGDTELILKMTVANCNSQQIPA